MIYFIYIILTHLSHGNIWTHNWPAPNVSGFIAQLVRASHRCCEITGSNPVEVLNFFQASLCSCINCVHNCEDHPSLDEINLFVGKGIFFITVCFRKHVWSVKVSNSCQFDLAFHHLIVLLVELCIYMYYLLQKNSFKNHGKQTAQMEAFLKATQMGRVQCTCY